MSIRTFLRAAVLAAAGLAPVLLAVVGPSSGAEPLDKRLVEAEAKRIALIEKVKPAVIAVLAPGGQGGGSGAIITDDGYALTNFHVAAAIGSEMHVGMTTGEMYDAVVVGLDRGGDLSLIKILPKKLRETEKFPTVKLGDSDKLKPGDMTLAMGNPLLLATDFNPTVTFGMVSGTHRYQKIPHPAGVLLEYCDCIQVDTSINPGNSGGPLFNMDGEFVGINSAGSLGKSDRINSGAAYSISINMIKNFLGQLRAGLECDHATLGAEVDAENEEGGFGQLSIRRVLTYSDVGRRGLEPDDKLVRFGDHYGAKDDPGFPMTNFNQYKNKLGIYPKGWRVPIVYRHQGEKRIQLVRLMGLSPEEEPAKPGDEAKHNPAAWPPPPLPPPPAGSEAAKSFEAKPGYANYFFNKIERDRLLKAFHKTCGDYGSVQGDWGITAECLIKGKKSPAVIAIKAATKDDKNDEVVGNVNGLDLSVEPLNTTSKLEVLRDPPDSGGLYVSLFQYRQLLAFGEKGFSGDFSHGGVEPLYLPPTGDGPPDFAKQRVMAEVLRTKLAGVPAKWYFSPDDGRLLAYEVTIDRDEDPCEVYLSDYQAAPGVKNGMMPNRLEVRYKEKTYAVLNVSKWNLQAAK